MNARLTLSDITGGAVPVLSALADDPQFKSTRDLNPVVAMTMARNIAQQRALDLLMALVDIPLAEAYAMYVLTNGEHADCVDRNARDNWEAGIDDVVEAVFAPYEKNLSGDWLGRNTIDTRLHEAVDEHNKLVKSFADEVWKCLVNVIVDDETEGKRVEELSTAKILSAVGVVRDDVETLLKERPEPTVQMEQAHIMSNLNEVLTKIKEFTEMAGMDEKNIVACLENAIDDDDGLASGGIQALGGDMADVEPLRMFAMQCEGESPADDLYDLMNGNVSETLVAPAEDDAAELAAMSGNAAPQSPAGAPTLPPPVQNAGAPPKRRTSRSKAEAGMPTPGAVPARAFELIREHVKVKDEDVGSMLGVSRQTFINYTKGKPVLVPSPEQKAALTGLIDTALKGLQEARTLITAVST